MYFLLYVLYSFVLHDFTHSFSLFNRTLFYPFLSPLRISYFFFIIFFLGSFLFYLIVSISFAFSYFVNFCIYIPSTTTAADRHRHGRPPPPTAAHLHPRPPPTATAYHHRPPPRPPTAHRYGPPPLWTPTATDATAAHGHRHHRLSTPPTATAGDHWHHRRQPPPLPPPWPPTATAADRPPWLPQDAAAPRPPTVIASMRWPPISTATAAHWHWHGGPQRVINMSSFIGICF